MIPADIERSMVPQEVASVPDVVETGDDGKGEGEPEEGGHEPGVGVGQLGEEKSLQSEGLQEEPDQGGDTESDLESGLPFAAPVRGNNLSLFDCNLAQAGHQELAGKDDDDDPGRTEYFLVVAEEDEGGGGEDLVGDGVQEFAEGGDEVEFAREVTIQEISDGSHDEGHQGDAVADGPPATQHEADHEDGRENEAGDSERVGQVQQTHCGLKSPSSPTTLHEVRDREWRRSVRAAPCAERVIVRRCSANSPSSPPAGTGDR